MPSNSGHSMSLARSTRRTILQPERSATSARRCELDEFGDPTTSSASTWGATGLTASWRFVVA